MDTSDLDLWVLCEPDGSMLEAFWPEVATPENLNRAIDIHLEAQLEEQAAS